MIFSNYLVLKDYSNNELTKLPVELENLEEIYLLDLSHNNFKHIPKEFASIPVKILDLSYNKISENNSVISSNYFIQELNLSHNNLHSIPQDILDLPNLCKLDLSFNQIDQLPTKLIPYITQIPQINLNENLVPYWKEKIISYNKLRGKIIEEDIKLVKEPYEEIKQSNSAIYRIVNNERLKLKITQKWASEISGQNALLSFIYRKYDHVLDRLRESNIEIHVNQEKLIFIANQDQDNDVMKTKIEHYLGKYIVN